MSHRNSHTHAQRYVTMFTAATFMIEKSWKSSKFPHREKHANKLSPGHTIVYNFEDLIFIYTDKIISHSGSSLTLLFLDLDSAKSLQVKKGTWEDNHEIYNLSLPPN